MNATTVRLGDVATFVRGITFKPADVLDEITVDAVGCMRTKNVQTQLDEKDVWFLPKNFVTSKNQMLQEGDLLVSTANSWNLVGKACWVPKLTYECTFGGFISALRATDTLIDRRYLYYWFTSSKVQAELRSFGNKTTNISNLSIKRANDLVVPLPPLPQQKRIAAILDKAAEIESKREEAIAKLDELASSIFTNSFVSKGLPTRTLQQVCELITDGTHYTPKDIGSGYPFLTVKDMSSTGLDLEECSFISKEDFELVKAGNCSPQIGDVLFSKDGTVGKVHVVTEDTEFGVLSSIAILRPNSKIIHPQYLGYALKSPEILSSALAKKTGAAIRRIILANLKSLTIPLPTLNQQEKFVNEVNALHDLQSGCRLNLLKLNELLASLQHQAFTTGFTA